MRGWGRSELNLHNKLPYAVKKRSTVRSEMSFFKFFIGGGGGRARSVAVRRTEALPTLAGGVRVSALRGEEAGRFREVAGVAAGGPR